MQGVVSAPRRTACEAEEAKGAEGTMIDAAMCLNDHMTTSGETCSDNGLHGGQGRGLKGLVYSK
jgi:hypothetical protein